MPVSGLLSMTDAGEGRGIGLVILGIVAIVAVIGLVLMFTRPVGMVSGQQAWTEPRPSFVEGYEVIVPAAIDEVYVLQDGVVFLSKKTIDDAWVQRIVQHQRITTIVRKARALDYAEEDAEGVKDIIVHLPDRSTLENVRIKLPVEPRPVNFNTISIGFMLSYYQYPLADNYAVCYQEPLSAYTCFLVDGDALRAYVEGRISEERFNEQFISLQSVYSLDVERFDELI